MRDLAEVFDPSLRLPIRGKTYVVPAPTAAAGMRLMALAVISATATLDPDSEKLRDALVLTDGEDLDFIKLSLSTAYDEMLADDVPYAYIEHAGQTAWMHWCFGADAATEYWESGGKATAAMTPQPPIVTTSSSTVTASTTKRRASGNTTTSRKTSSAASKRKRTAKP